jgi:ABC-type bacteriocin/lantibiotic exporter with double-glycine peptidase domain
MKEATLIVPYYSQYDHITDIEWKPRACGIAALSMLIAYHRKENISPDEVLARALRINAFGPSGWVHDKLIEVANSFDVSINRFDIKEYSDERVLDFLDEALERGMPVIVSVSRRFDEALRDKYHQVVIVGRHKKDYFYHDPEYTNAEGVGRVVSSETLLSFWRKLGLM